MTLIEALKSGKRYRLKGDIAWHDENGKGVFKYTFTPDEILRNDWDVEPTMVKKAKTFQNIKSTQLSHLDGTVKLVNTGKLLKVTIEWEDEE